MKFSVQRAPLQRALSHIQSVAEKRNTIPVLANVLLEVKGGSLSLTGTDMEIELVERIQASNTQDGRTTVPAGTLFQLVRNLADDSDIEFLQEGPDAPLKLQAGTFNASLNTLPAEDFPAIHAGNLPHKFSLPAKSLLNLIDRTRFAMSTEETRYYLNGIYFHAYEGEGKPVLRAVATDAHRLALAEVALPAGASDIPGVIVPRKTINELRKLITSDDAQVHVSLSESRIQFMIEDIHLASKLIDGTFPEYERVIPRDNKEMLRVNKESLAAAVNLVSVLSEERNRAVKLALKTNQALVSAVSAERGDSREELGEDSVTYNGQELEICFQARLLSEVLEQFPAEMNFALASSTAPALITDPSLPDVLYVLMPIRI